MPDLDVAEGTPARLDGIEEIRPEFLDVLLVRLVQFRVFVDDRLALVARIEGPAVEPALMEGAVGAVEVAADVGLLRLVARVETMLPLHRERLELEDGV